MTFEAFEYMFLSLLQGCVIGTSQAWREAEAPLRSDIEEDPRFADEGPTSLKIGLPSDH